MSRRNVFDKDNAKESFSSVPSSSDSSSDSTSTDSIESYISEDSTVEKSVKNKQFSSAKRSSSVAIKLAESIDDDPNSSI